jgi:hypothetical protein
MNIPAELLRNVPAMIDFGKEAFIKGFEGQVGAFMFRQIGRVLGPYIPALAQVDPREMALRVRRLEMAAFGFSDEMEELAAEGEAVLPEELDEPTAGDFVADALHAAMDTPSTVKQEVLGRSIVRRLSARTESPEELYLRQALSIVRRCNNDHLYALATLRLVRHTPLPENLSRDDAQGWLDDTLLPLLERAAANDPQSDVLDYVVSIGAAFYSEREWYDVASGMNSHAPSIEQRLIESTWGHEIVVPGLAPQGRFYQLAVRLDQGESNEESGTEAVALAPYSLTAPGIAVAKTVLDVIETSIRTAAAEHMTNRDIPETEKDAEMQLDEARTSSE